MINKLLKFLKKIELDSKIKKLESEREELIQSGKTQLERDRSRALALSFDRVHKRKLTIEDEKWLDEHDKKERKREEINENNRKKIEQKRNIERKKYLTEKYGNDNGEKLHKGELWVGMTYEMLNEVKGEPGKKTETISRNKKREELFFDGYKNRQGNKSYKFRVVLIDGKVDGWNDIKN